LVTDACPLVWHQFRNQLASFAGSRRKLPWRKSRHEFVGFKNRMPLTPYLKEAVFEPKAIEAMTAAFEAVCKSLQLLNVTVRQPRLWPGQSSTLREQANMTPCECTISRCSN